ncbi:MAG: fructokinase [Candidatus Binatota bacterium]|nr:fructokinase [Candidatus Binatota bacterium]
MRIGVDLGGTKIEAIALDAERSTRGRIRRPTPRDDYHATVAAIVDVVAAVERIAGARGTVGIGTPGAVSPATGCMKNCNSTWLNGKPLHRDLAAALGRPLRVANDADCLALSEAIDGAAAGAAVAFGVILGTGVGGGVVVERRPLSGPNAIAGEWGHNPLPWPHDDERPGAECYCGKRGCIETFLSGPGMARDYAAATTDSATPAEIAARAGAGDPAAAATIERYVDRLARALATVVNVLDPHVVVLAGGMSNLPDLCERVRDRWGGWTFSDRTDTRLALARHGDSSGVRGAALLWETGLGTREG